MDRHILTETSDGSCRWRPPGSTVDKTVSRPDWVSEGLDIIPAPARITDALLGGCHNFRADRDLADQVVLVWPGFDLIAWAQMAFGYRVVQWLTGRGIRQFLDIGCGLTPLFDVPKFHPDVVRVVYADIDPIVVSRVNHELGQNPAASIIAGDLREPDTILSHPHLLDRLDFGEPVGVLLTGVLPHLTDTDNPAAIIAQIRDTLVTGSYLAISHLASTPGREWEQEQLSDLYDHTPVPLEFRTRPQIADLVGTGWGLVEPGIVAINQLAPRTPPHRHAGATKPARGSGACRMTVHRTCLGNVAVLCGRQPARSSLMRSGPDVPPPGHTSCRATHVLIPRRRRLVQPNRENPHKSITVPVEMAWHPQGHRCR